MPIFEYKGRDISGKLVTGTLNLPNAEAVTKELARSQIIPISIKQHRDKIDWSLLLTSPLEFRGPNLLDLMLLNRQLYSLTRSGVPIIRAIKLVLENTKNRKLREALETVITDLESGVALHMAFRRAPTIFPSLMVALVEVGENSGSLDEVFRQITVHFEREMETVRNIKVAVRYPFIVLIALVAAIILINIFVIPAFASFFAKFHSKLPLPTRMLIGFSDFMVAYWHLLVGCFVALGSGFSYYIHTVSGRLWWDGFKTKIPIFGSIIYRALLARFARVFALSYRTGVPLLDTIGLISKSVDNVYVGEKVNIMRNFIEHGESITSAAAASGLFSPIIIQMMTIGEETGEIDKLLDEVAVVYEEEVSYETKRLGDAIEPLLITLIAGMVLILALGVYLPMWDLSKVVISNA